MRPSVICTTGRPGYTAFPEVIYSHRTIYFRDTLRDNVPGNTLLEVLTQFCLLTDEEKVKMCEIVSKSGADYIKTSTGFSKGGATFADVELFAKNVAPHLKIKAAGGISSLEDAEKFIALGASRLGTSRVVKAVKEAENG